LLPILLFITHTNASFQDYWAGQKDSPAAS